MGARRRGHVVDQSWSGSRFLGQIVTQLYLEYLEIFNCMYKGRLDVV